MLTAAWAAHAEGWGWVGSRGRGRRAVSKAGPLVVRASLLPVESNYVGDQVIQFIWLKCLRPEPCRLCPLQSTGLLSRGV